MAILWMVTRSGHLDLKVITKLFSDPLSATILLSLGAANMLLLTWRWQVIVTDTIRLLRFFRAVQLYLIGSLFNYIFPSSIGGDVVRGFYLAQDLPENKMKAALSVVADRLIGLYSLITLGTVSLVWSSLTRGTSGINALTYSTVVLFLGYSFCLFMLISGIGKKILSKVTYRPLQKPIGFLFSCHDYLQTTLKDPSLLFKTFFIGMISQVLVSVFFYAVAIFIHEPNVNFVDLLSVTPLGFLVMSIPISPAGIGVGQVAYLFLMKQVTGESSDFGPTAITAFQLTLLFWSLFGGWFYLTLKKPKELEESA